VDAIEVHLVTPGQGCGASLIGVADLKYEFHGGISRNALAVGINISYSYSHSATPK
jgi:hypothetical protein